MRSRLPAMIMLAGCFASAAAQQIAVPRIEAMPAVPSPLTIPDWSQRARDYESLVFNRTASGQHLPLIWTDATHINNGLDGFGLPSYVGSSSQTSGAAHEAVTCLGSLVGGTFNGTDFTTLNGSNFVLMAQNYYNTANAQNLVLNGTSAQSGATFWYEIWPHVLFYQLADRYPGFGSSSGIMFTTANKWYSAAGVMGGNVNAPNFDYTAYNFTTSQPVSNGIWREPDAAAGVAWMQYAAYRRFGSANYLNGAKWGLDYLEGTSNNPNYEILLSYGAYTAARMNAEQGTTYDVEKLVNWVFEPSSTVRSGWGCIVGSWNGYQVNGLMGSTTDGGGYAFSFPTFANAGALVPMARYDDRFARAIGRWMLNVSANARLFYRDQLPLANQSSGGWAGDPNAAIAYEGLRKTWLGNSPYATGDAVANGWAATDFALYGGGYVGYLGSIVSPTNVPEVLKLDCLATDVYTGPTYPTSIYYNPTGSVRLVAIALGESPSSIYDAAGDRWMATNRTGNQLVVIEPDTAILAVLVPADGIVSSNSGRLLVNGTVIDFHAPAPSSVEAWHEL